MGIDDIGRRWSDPDYVANYLRFTRGVRFDGALWARTLEVGEESVVADLGCGECKLLVALSPYVSRGIGIDASAPALEHARRNIEAAGVTNVEVFERDLRNLDLASESVNAVVSIAALHHVPDEEKLSVLKSVHDSLVPAGIFHLEDDTFNFPPERFTTMVPAMYREFEKRFGEKGWAFLRRELAGEDFECTPYLQNLLKLIGDASLELLSVTELGLNGAVIRARRPPATGKPAE